MALEDKEKKLLQTIIIRGNDIVSKDEQKLIFTRLGNQRFLTEMITREMGLPIAKTNDTKQNLKAKGQPERKTQDVSIASKK